MISFPECESVVFNMDVIVKGMVGIMNIIYFFYVHVLENNAKV